MNAEEREVLGKKVEQLRRVGHLPAHVFGKKVKGENVAVELREFLKISKQAGETGVIDLKIGHEKVRPVMIRAVQKDHLTGQPIHVDFYQVNLSEKVTVPVPIILVGEQPESVHLGESIVLQTLNEVQVEALPTDLVEHIEVDITTLKNIDDAITVAELKYDISKLKLHAEPEEVVVKLAPAVSAEMEALLEEQAAETAETQAEVAGEQAKTEGEGETEVGSEQTAETVIESTDDKAQ